MPAKTIAISSLLFDLQNPRINKPLSQDSALQQIIEDQGIKLLALAESVLQDGLNPMDRMLVISDGSARKYTVLEGNRRLAVLRLLGEPKTLQRIEMRQNLRRRLALLSVDFAAQDIKRVDVFVLGARSEGASWIRQRHTGENEGRGIVDWNGIARARFRGSDPALQALDFVIKHGGLSDEEKSNIENRFPITTLDRLIQNPGVRTLIGVTIQKDKLQSNLPIEELIKPLRRFVRDLLNGVINVTKIKQKEQQIAYAKSLAADLPDLGKKGASSVRVDELENSVPPAAAAPALPAVKPKAKPVPPQRRSLIHSDCELKVSNPKIAEIEGELRALPLVSFPHAISILFRVFLEQSVDTYLIANGASLTVPSRGSGENLKSLRVKVKESIEIMKAAGVPRNVLDGVAKGIDDQKSPLCIETLNNYVHNAFFSPTERDLRVAWDNSRRFFETIWA